MKRIIGILIIVSLSFSLVPNLAEAKFGFGLPSIVKEKVEQLDEKKEEKIQEQKPKRRPDCTLFSDNFDSGSSANWDFKVDCSGTITWRIDGENYLSSPYSLSLVFDSKEPGCISTSATLKQHIDVPELLIATFSFYARADPGGCTMFVERYDDGWWSGEGKALQITADWVQYSVPVGLVSGEGPLKDVRLRISVRLGDKPFKVFFDDILITAQDYLFVGQ